MSLCQTHNFCLHIIKAHGYITMRECIAFIHDPYRMLTFGLKVKFIGFFIWLCVWSAIDIVIPYFSWGYHHG